MKNTNRWNAVCGESRMHGVEWGKSPRWYQRLTYHYKESDTISTKKSINRNAIARIRYSLSIYGLSVPNRIIYEITNASCIHKISSNIKSRCFVHPFAFFRYILLQLLINIFLFQISYCKVLYQSFLSYSDYTILSMTVGNFLYLNIQCHLFYPYYSGILTIEFLLKIPKSQNNVEICQNTDSVLLPEGLYWIHIK